MKEISEQNSYEANEYEDYTEEEIENSSNDISSYDIAVFYNTYNLSALLNWWDKKLIVPNFQRSFVWDKKQASEFVDSLLRGLPVPSMFFYDDTQNSKLLVIDGQQRMTSLFYYVTKKTFGDKVFKLTGNVSKKWEGKTFDELEPEEQERLYDTLMNVTLMRQIKPDDGQSSMYLAFQRINTGGVSLKPQEVRMAVSYGDFSKLIYRFSTDERFNKWTFLQTAEEKKRNNYWRIQELIVRVFAFYDSIDGIEASSLRSFLDEYFSDHRNLNNIAKKKPNIIYRSEEELVSLFNKSLDILSVLNDDDLSPASRPTQIFFESVWLGIMYKQNVLNQEIDRSHLPVFVNSWKNEVSEQTFSELFQARRSTAISSINFRLSEIKKYFGRNF